MQKLLLSALLALQALSLSAMDLSMAMFCDDYEAAKAALQRGTPVDKPFCIGQTPLSIAAMKQNGPLIKLLLAAGANTEAQDPGLVKRHPCNVLFMMDVLKK